MVELLIALTISSVLLTTALVALDSTFKRYTVVSENASTHVVARTVMHRIQAMIRTGSDFAPYPVDVLDTTQNPRDYSYIEFVSQRDASGSPREITRIERRAASTTTINSESTRLRGPFVLWVRVTSFAPGSSSPTVQEFPMLDGVAAANFNLEYEPGPRLVRATVDLTVLPLANAVQTNESGTFATTTTGGNLKRSITSDATGQTIRLVATTSPRD
jgi:hypothetical protein